MSESKQITRYLVMAMRKPDFSDEVIAPHLAFLDALRAEGKLEMTGGFSDKIWWRLRPAGRIAGRSAGLGGRGSACDFRLLCW